MAKANEEKAIVEEMGTEVINPVEKNEVVSVDKSTGEIVLPQKTRTLVAVKDGSNIYQLSDGTYQREQIYQPYASFTPSTLEEKKKLFSVMSEEDSPFAKKMKNMQGETIQIDEVFIQPYEEFDEVEGSLNKVRCIIFDKEKDLYISTTSVGVYFSLGNIFNAFGKPTDPNYEAVKVKIGKKAFEKGDTNTITLV